MGAAAAVILMKERRIVEAFERAGATSPASARTPDDLGVDPHGIGWRRLRDHAVVREAIPGADRYYVDVDVWQALRRMRRRNRARPRPRDSLGRTRAYLLNGRRAVAASSAGSAAVAV